MEILRKFVLNQGKFKTSGAELYFFLEHDYSREIYNSLNRAWKKDVHVPSKWNIQLDVEIKNGNNV